MAEAAPSAGLYLAWAWLLLLLPLPWLARRWLSAAPRAGLLALKVPWFARVAGTGEGWIKRTWLAVIAGLAWVLLLLAAARPQWVGEIETLPVTGRDLLLAVDISGSMDTQDMVLDGQAVNRLAVVKRVAGSSSSGWATRGPGTVRQPRYLQTR
jgi:Ca-activated chloride channel family protein